MGKNVKEIVKTALKEMPTISNRDIARLAGISRQAVHAHLQELVERGEIVKEGAGRGTYYRWPSGKGRGAAWPKSAAVAEKKFTYRVQGLAEDQVWTELAPQLPHMANLNTNARHILHYALTELLNNVIDHSRSSTVSLILCKMSNGCLELTIDDHGVGAFESIRQHFGLENHLHALELVHKGKATTQPERHSGEGLFFVSRSVEYFELVSNGLSWHVDNTRGDFSVAQTDRKRGTKVRIEIATHTTKQLKDVFDAHTTDYEFSKTRTVVKLFAMGTTFMSRSEAKRLVQGLEQFKEVVLDFNGVASVGQGFCDEIFRVWANAHPSTQLTPINMEIAVDFMVRRALVKV